MSSGRPPVPGERTPEEREAARREREARRAARRAADGDGRPPPKRDWLSEARRWLAGDGRSADTGEADEPARVPQPTHRAEPEQPKQRPQAPPQQPQQPQAQPQQAQAPPQQQAPRPQAPPQQAPPQPQHPRPQQPQAQPQQPQAPPPQQAPPRAQPQAPQPTMEQPVADGQTPAAHAAPVAEPPARQAQEPAVTEPRAREPQAPPLPEPPAQRRAQAPPLDGRAKQGAAPAKLARQRRAQSAERLRSLSRGVRLREHRPGRVRAGRLTVAVTLLLLAAVAGWFLVSLFQPLKGEGGTEVRVVVPRGASLDQIAELLEERGVVSSSFFFQTRARLTGRSGALRPGHYRLRENMSYAAALDQLEKGTPPNIVVLTIPEGRSRREVADIVDGRLEGRYMRATLRSPLLDPRDYKAENARNLEGFLFPATYELKKGRPMSALVEQQLNAFKQRFEEVDLRYARSKNLTPYDVLTIASLVEREAALPKERPLIASVIYNRLKEGMPLGIDATVRYITGNWTEPLKQSELANPSPYNTRLNAGLPPGPIGNPGIESIKAAARPARTGYLFFVVKPGGDGAHAFARTDAEHQRNVERYNSARERLGGRSPD